MSDTTADPHGEVRVYEGPRELARAAAERFAELAAQAVKERGAFSVALAGGTTPRHVYELLAGDDFRDKIHWPDVHVFFGDERAVPPDHADSNYRMASEALLSRVPVPAENVHRMKGEGDAAANARQYEDELRAFFGDSARPRFDLVMLGMGDDGHTASLFPSTQALEETRAWVVANWVEKLNAWRVTLTAPAVNAARHVLFLVGGGGKAARLREVLRGERDTTRLPSQLVAPDDGALEWFIDRAAAADLEDI
ncbi:MAG TPA: 6-phosphogluconolactonase [Pyrinomonadaceae bacterium]|jgi:6-phosphogluconolactonase|nr:6-phosphogluconolactonase [Pyrinomonadaceae bacterium]